MVPLLESLRSRRQRIACDRGREPGDDLAEPARSVANRRCATARHREDHRGWPGGMGDPRRAEGAQRADESADERREAREIEAARGAALENVDWTRRFDVRRVPSLNYAASDGCGNVYLYAFTSDRAEAISVRVDRSELQLSTTARSFDIARHPTSITVNVTVYQQPMRHTEVCTDVGISPAPVTETWRAVAGQMTIELSPPGIRTRTPWLYRATIRIDNAEFIDSSGRRHRQAAPIVLSAVVGSGAG